MISKNECLQELNNMITVTDDEYKKGKMIGYFEKIDSISDEQFENIAKNSLGENCGIGDFRKWITNRLEHELVGTEFIELNDMVSYNIAGNKKDTIALHVVPKHVSKDDIRNMGPYLVDALEQLSKKIESGEIQDVNCVFAVSNILKSKRLQEGFKALRFEVGKADEVFRGHFKNPYQAKIDVETMLSEEWRAIKDEFKSKQAIIDVHASERSNGKKSEISNNNDKSDDVENR